jgi:hypothetical protein
MVSSLSPQDKVLAFIEAISQYGAQIKQFQRTVMEELKQ